MVGKRASGLFFSDDLFDEVGSHGGDVGSVSRLRVGHDGGGVGVDEDDFVAFFSQGFASLGSGVVELAGLSDYDGTRAEDHDFLQIGSLPDNLRRERFGLYGGI